MLAGAHQTAAEDFRVIRVTNALDPGDGSTKDIGADYYISGGETHGFRVSMLLDVYRPIAMSDPFAGKDHVMRILIGQVKVIRVFESVAVTRVYALEPLRDNPITRHRSVMIGDYAVPRPDSAPTPAELSLPSDILFGFNEWRLTSAAMEALSVAYDVLSQAPDQDLVIEGHTCDQGSDRYNMALSRKRAQSTADFLATVKGVSRGRLHVAGYGEMRPVASNADEHGKRQNRRVEIRVMPRNASIARAP